MKYPRLVRDRCKYIPSLVKGLNLTEEKPGYFTTETDGIIIRCGANKGEIYFASCPDIPRLGNDPEYRDRWTRKQAQFFEKAFPTWKGADLAVTQMWIVMETAQQREMTIPFNDIVIHPSSYLEGCRVVTMRKR